MKTKNIIIGTGVLVASTAVGLGVICSRLYRDSLTRGVASKTIDNTDYGDLSKRNDDAEAWFLQQNYQDVELLSQGRHIIRGKILQHQDCNNWIILVHGYKCDYTSILYQAKTFYENGYNILVYDNRAHGNSDGKYLTMGSIEQYDVLGWINYIIQIDNNSKIVLFGVSMGAATVMICTGNMLPSNVVCAIEDCGYTSAHDIFLDQGYKKYHVNISPILYGIDFLSKRKTGHSTKDSDAIKSLKKSNTPTLFIHGDQDTFVPFEMIYHNYEACNASKELIVIENQKHATACLDKNYYQHIFKFINKYL